MIDSDYLEACVSIDEIAYQEELIRIPPDYAYWSEQYSIKKEAHRYAKLECERVRGELSITLRLELESQKSRVTESMLTSAIDTHADWLASKRAEISAEAEVARHHGILEALRTKREMLISLGAHARAEMKTI